VRISAHAYEELRNDGIRLRDVVLSLPAAQIVEDLSGILCRTMRIDLAEGSRQSSASCIMGHSERATEPCRFDNGIPSYPCELVRGLFETEEVMTRTIKKLIHEGKYVAEVSVELIEEPGGWSPYYSLEDAEKLEAAADALRKGDLAAASQYGRVFELLPVST
jgi:hypothetical protein